jgi:HTH-type transcriptional regulator/antitoxin HipB
MKTSIRTSGQLGPALKQLRKAKAWSQLELGRRIGLSQERISAIENNPEKVTFDQLLTVMMALEAEFNVELLTSPAANTVKESSSTSTRTTKPKESW